MAEPLAEPMLTSAIRNKEFSFIKCTFAYEMAAILSNGRLVLTQRYDHGYLVFIIFEHVL